MADEKKQTLLLDLDSAEFIKKMLHARGQLKDLGEADNLSGLINGLTSATKILGVVGIAALAAKTALDLTIEGESIRAINYQFENLAKNAGLAGDELKEGLKKAADGLVDDTDLLKSANKAIVQLGVSAAKLPEVMELSRKATAGFGGDLMENFENINRAIATGQTRFLKSIGLTIDADKAYKNYAKSVGQAVSTLSDAQKQQAVLNEVIKKGQTAYAGIDTDITKTANTWKQLKVTMSEISETFVLFFEKTMGERVRHGLEKLANTAKGTGVWIKSIFGEGDEKVEARAQVLEGRISDVNKRLAEFNKAPGAWGPEIKFAQEQLARLKAELEEVNKTRKKSEEIVSGETNKPKLAPPDYEKIKEQESKFQKELLKMKQDRYQKDQELATSEEEAERIHYERMALEAQEYQNKLTLIEQNSSLTPDQKNVMVEELGRQHADKMIQMEEDLADKKIAAMERVDKSRASSDQKFMTGMKATSAKAAKEWGGMGKVGERAFTTLSKRAGDAFIAMGEGSQDAGEAMRGFMLGSIADIAEAEGRMLLASVLVNPAHGAAGAALLVLAGMLRSQAKSSKSIGGGESGGGGTEASTASSLEPTKPDQAEKLQKKTMTVNFMGDYLETEATQTRLLELIRQGSDATDFRYNKIGV